MVKLVAIIQNGKISDGIVAIGAEAVENISTNVVRFFAVVFIQLLMQKEAVHYLKFVTDLGLGLLTLYRQHSRLMMMT